MKGSKEERSPGVWRFRVHAGPGPGGKPRYVSKTWKNIVNGRLQPGGDRRADTELAKFVAQVASGNRPAVGTVSELLDRWMEHIEPDRSPHTMRAYRSSIERAIKPKLGKLRLGRLTPLLLDEWYRELRKTDLSPSTIRQYHAILAAALHQAYRWGLVDEIATGRVKAPAARRHTATAPDPEEVRALIARADEDDWRRAIVVYLAASTGARRGELCAVRRSDIDLGRRRITLRGTKTEESYRTIALDEGSAAAIELHYRRQADCAAQALVELDSDPFLCAPDPDAGRPFHPDNVSHFVSRLTSGSMHIHQLRHFQATQLLGAGLDAVTVAGRLGHADARTTLEVYAHFIARRDEVAAGHMGELLVPGPNKPAARADQREEQDKGADNGGPGKRSGG